ncbi:protoporphyrinogen oxidase [Opitutus sp. GAS368]|uniref:protoporphyrinogen oxidase n=1 Tax=Opitutus sp. GAS368 TaxID=1882749 RepID=UPI000879398E|nr:protoporphyrinogen oxidase [Opitutus sp. GAS368]SDR65398.1 oxygen-dependent protoporphyrinogen oxidase [Opitutus sp. GAS368]
MAKNSASSIAVVGGGLTGLTAAWRLHQAGHRVTVFEKAPQVGGAIVTTERDGWLVEGGPNSLQETPEVAALIAELGLTDQRALVSPTARKRFIVRDGRPVMVPLSPAGLLTSPLFSLGARLRVLTELLTRPRVRTTDVNLASFVASHFGREIVDYGLNPFVLGVYAGDPEKLSARYAFPNLWQLERSHGSLLRGFRAQAAERRTRGDAAGVVPIISFQHGLQTLPRALAAALPAGTVQTEATVTSLIPGQPWKLIWTRADAVTTVEFDAVVLALPATGLAQLVFSTLGERTLASLDHQPHPPVSSLFLGFRREQVAHPLDGFGALVPAREQRSLLGVLFSSSLFAGRAPDGHVALTVFAGGMRQPETGRLDTATLLARVLPDLRELLGVTGDPVFTHHTFWPKAIPQYNLGHERFLEPLARCEVQHKGLFIGGNARDGISLPDCLKSGAELARKTGEFVTKL